MMIASLVMSAIFLAIVNAVAHFRKGTEVATLCSFAAVFLFFCMTTPLLLLNAFGVAVTGAICWAVKASPGRFLVFSFGATMAAYAIIIGFLVMPELGEWARLKDQYPLDSLAPRLAYEDRFTTVPPSQGSAADRLVSLELRLHQQEIQFDSQGRKQSLQHLHAGVVKQFIDSPGFGFRRMVRRPSPYFLNRQQQEDLALPQLTSPDQPADLLSSPVRIGLGPDFLTAHDDNTVDFLNPGGFGYIVDREHVAGFRPHQFRRSPHGPQRWQVNRVELVGFLKHEVPKVYLSANFPRMDELSQATTRPLDAFEKEALAGLKSGEDLMLQETPQRMRMLASLRAVQQCLPCHRVQRGELLGAFSYLMVEEAQPPK